MTATNMVTESAIPSISEAVTASRLGDTVLASRLLDLILGSDPRNEQALLWKAALCGTGETAEYYLQQVLDINPSNEQAFETLRMLRLNRDIGRPEMSCPVCFETSAQSQPQDSNDACASCGMVQKLGSWRHFLANQAIDEVLLQKAVQRWKRGMERAPSAGTAYLLALGYLNLKRSGEACFYLENALAMGVDEPGIEGLIRYFQSQKLILAVDEDALVRRFVSAILTRAGFRVITAESADEGMRLFDQFVPHLVVSDDTSPDRNGIELCRQIRKSGSTTPVVLMSNRLLDRLKGRLAGATDCMSKPFGPETLASTVRRNLAA